MIQEDYVSFLTVKLLKENGFDEPCFRYTENDGDDWTAFMRTEDSVGIPTLQLARKWLRETFGIEIQTDVCKYGKEHLTRYTWIPVIVTDTSLLYPMDNGGYPPSVGVEDTYETAAEAGVVWVLQHLDILRMQHNLKNI